MGSTWQDRRWVTLAQAAGRTMGAPSTSMTRAILAQWQCEQPWPAPWPPVHRNPGNLTRLIGSLGGPPPPVAQTAPGAGLLYLYPTPLAGAIAFGRYLVNSRRYRTALAAARAGNGARFLSLVCQAGYGTRESCCLSLYARATIPAPIPSAAHWRAVYDRVNIRAAANVTAPVVGHTQQGHIYTGSLVTGGRYHVGGADHTGWVRLSSGHYTASYYYRRV